MHSVCITRRRFTFHCNIFSYVSYLYYHYCTLLSILVFAPIKTRSTGIVVVNLKNLGFHYPSCNSRYNNNNKKKKIENHKHLPCNTQASNSTTTVAAILWLAVIVDARSLTGLNFRKASKFDYSCLLQLILCRLDEIFDCEPLHYKCAAGGLLLENPYTRCASDI